MQKFKFEHITFSIAWLHGDFMNKQIGRFYPTGQSNNNQ